jgi:hypothetical protein
MREATCTREGVTDGNVSGNVAVKASKFKVELFDEVPAKGILAR